MIHDTPVHRADLSQLTDEELEQLVTEIQHRRLLARREFEQLEALRNEKMLARTREDLDHTLAMLRKDFDTVEKRLSKIQERMVKVRAFRTRIRADQLEEAIEKDTLHHDSV